MKATASVLVLAAMLAGGTANARLFRCTDGQRPPPGPLRGSCDWDRTVNGVCAFAFPRCPSCPAPLIVQVRLHGNRMVRRAIHGREFICRRAPRAASPN